MRLPKFAQVLALGASAWLCAVTLAEACSPAPGYIQPTSFELVQLADVILVARAEADVTRGESPMGLRFSGVKALKGQSASNVVVLGELGAVRGSDPAAIGVAHPESFRGGCVRHTFTKGKSYVLFLSRGSDGELRRLDFPFTPNAEDYYGDNAPWPSTIKAYVDIQSKFPSGDWSRRVKRNWRQRPTCLRPLQCPMITGSW